ncbi:MAG: hypothetical protein BWX52_00803 [Bacteroidetes bacterium ADurb.Bin013]|nr:MAG: hypothetical protein BWX52_00803 [Bacteroidetes bacterium ADurb.Bin013]
MGVPPVFTAHVLVETDQGRAVLLCNAGSALGQGKGFEYLLGPCFKDLQHRASVTGRGNRQHLEFPGRCPAFHSLCGIDDPVHIHPIHYLDIGFHGQGEVVPLVVQELRGIHRRVDKNSLGLLVYHQVRDKAPSGARKLDFRRTGRGLLVGLHGKSQVCVIFHRVLYLHAFHPGWGGKHIPGHIGLHRNSVGATGSRDVKGIGVTGDIRCCSLLEYGPGDHQGILSRFGRGNRKPSLACINTLIFSHLKCQRFCLQAFGLYYGDPVFGQGSFPGNVRYHRNGDCATGSSGYRYVCLGRQ